MNIENIIKIAESLDWNVSLYGNEYELRRYSPKGQDFHTYIQDVVSAKDFIDSLYKNIKYYDPSEETSLWLDDAGHGINGAPYEANDIYDDMVACKNMMLDLLNAIS